MSDMNDTIQTPQPAPPTWVPTPPTPVRQRRRPSKRLVAILLAALVAVAAIVTLTVTTVQQHGKAVDARSTLADTRADLKGTEADLATTQGDLETTQTALTSAQSTISAQDDQLAVCGLAVDIGWHLWDGLDYALDVSGDMADFNVGAASSGLDQVNGEIDAVTSIIKSNGYTYIDDIFEGCDPASSNS